MSTLPIILVGIDGIGFAGTKLVRVPKPWLNPGGLMPNAGTLMLNDISLSMTGIVIVFEKLGGLILNPGGLMLTEYTLLWSVVKILFISSITLFVAPRTANTEILTIPIASSNSGTLLHSAS